MEIAVWWFLLFCKLVWLCVNKSDYYFGTVKPSQIMQKLPVSRKRTLTTFLKDVIYEEDAAPSAEKKLSTILYWMEITCKVHVLDTIFVTVFCAGFLDADGVRVTLKINTCNIKVAGFDDNKFALVLKALILYCAPQIQNLQQQLRNFVEPHQYITRPIKCQTSVLKSLLAHNCSYSLSINKPEKPI
ncbi:hypothetical protein HUJ05_001104 [Dendroctonus ponderosae]|nr:hypothetical protein HUJ05_001104 [Dendroctonus ponderosae]